MLKKLFGVGLILVSLSGCIDPDQIRIPETIPREYSIEGKKVKTYRNMFGPYQITEVRDANGLERFVGYPGYENWFAYELCRKDCLRVKADFVSFDFYEEIVKKNKHYIDAIREIEEGENPLLRYRPTPSRF